jgi:RHS repeat-associated protein
VPRRSARHLHALLVAVVLFASFPVAAPAAAAPRSPYAPPPAGELLAAPASLPAVFVPSEVYPAQPGLAHDVAVAPDPLAAATAPLPPAPPPGTAEWWAAQRSAQPLPTPAAPLRDTWGPGTTLPPVVPAPLVQPPAFAQPAIALAIDVPPQPLAVGDAATVRIRITNRAPIAAQDALLTLPIPDGVTLLAAPAQTSAVPAPAAPDASDTAAPADGQDVAAAPAIPDASPIDQPGRAHLLVPAAPLPLVASAVMPVLSPTDARWQLGSLPGQQVVELALSFSVDRMPQGEAVLLSPTLVASNLATPVTITRGAVVLAQPDQPAVIEAPRGRAAMLVSADGRVTVRLPAAAADQNLRVTHQYLRARGHGRPLPPSEGIFGRRSLAAFFLDAATPQGAPVTRFAAPLAITVRYTPEQLLALGIAEADLVLAYYDEQARQWIALPTTIDRAARTATAPVDHFTPFTLSDGSSPSQAFVPTLQGFQVSQFTGAASYSIPITLPQGPAGHTPQVSLDYSSAASDGTNGTRQYWQASWAGKGWSVTTGGSVARVRSAAGDFWDSFTLVLGGQSFDIVRGRPLNGLSYAAAGTAFQNWSWHPVDDSFLQMRFDAGANAWQVWTKDGTRYTFDLPLTTTDTQVDYVGQWLLTRVTDPHGNLIRYWYQLDTNGQYTPTHYLKYITWTSDGSTPGSGNHRYEVEFVASDRSTGYTAGVDANWEPTTGTFHPLMPHEKYRLDAIVVKAWGAGQAGWEEVRRYNLVYATAAASVASDNDSGQAVLTLKEVQQVGADGLTLPKRTFTYHPNTSAAGRNRLASVTNGQGGKITFSYDWAIAPPSHWQNYHRVTQTLREETSGKPYARSTLTTYSYSGAAMNVRDYAATVWWAQFPPAGHGAGDLSLLVHRENTEFRGHASVTETVYDGATTASPKLREQQTWFHQGSASCQVPVSNNQIDAASSCFLTMVQREAWKGKPFKEEVRSATSAVLQRTEYEYVRVSLPRFGADGDYANAEGASNHYQRAGLWRAFNAPSRTIVSFLEGVGASSQRITEQFYAPGGACTSASAADILASFGNLGCTRERDQVGTLLRATTLRYSTPPSTPYIVDKVHQRAVYDGSGNLRAITEFFYDGNHASAQAGSRGLVTLERAYRNVPLAASTQGVTLWSRDTAYAYDAWGSRTSVTTYASEGTRLFNGTTTSYTGPSGAATTTTTAYDGDAGAWPDERPWGLPRSTTNALGQTERTSYDYRWQALTSVTDANGQVTSAEYDGLGRVTKLIRPGATSAVPTRTFTYYDTEQPAPYLITQRQHGANGADPQAEIVQFYDGFGQLVQTKRESAAYNGRTTITDQRFDGRDRLKEQSQPRDVSETGAAVFAYTTPPAPLFRKTDTSYDALDRVVSVTAPDGTATTTSYGTTVVGARVDTLDAKNHCTRREQDVLGRLKQVVEFAGPGCSGTTSFTNYEYDPLDQLTLVQDALGNQTRNFYDTLGRKTEMRDPDMGTWTYDYTAHGNLQTQTDARGYTTTFGYDALDRLTSTSSATTWTDAFASQSATAWSWSSYQTAPYLVGGNPAVRSVGPNSWASGFWRSNFSLRHGNLVSVRFQVDQVNTQAHFMVQADDPTLQRFALLAENGGLVAQSVVNGVATKQTLLPSVQLNTWYVALITLNDVGQFALRVWPEASPTSAVVYRAPMVAGKDWRFGHAIYSGAALLDDYQELLGFPTYTLYDAAWSANGVGRRSATCVSDGSDCIVWQDWAYDTRGNASYAGQSVFGAAFGSSMTYDAADRLINRSIPQALAETLEYVYDPAGRPTRLFTSLGGDYVASASYTALDQADLWTVGSVVSDWGYSSPMARLSSVVAGPGGAVLNRSYAYDTVGNVETIIDSQRGQTQEFRYDHRDRLTQAWTTGATSGAYNQSYSYDALGNLLSKAGVSQTYGANGNGTGAGPHQARSVGGQSYSYDQNGNLLSGGGRALVWDHHNRVLRAAQGGVSESYLYDADGIRVQRLRQGVRTTYALGAVEHTSAATRVYYPFGSQTVGVRVVGGAMSYIYPDHLGSIGVTTDPAGVVTSRQEYDPWGSVRWTSGTVATARGYTGQYRDDTGLLYYNARYYDPGLGRFISADTIVPGSGPLTVAPNDSVAASSWAAGGGGPANPQDLNRYSYGLNNPVKHTDPTGHWVESAIDIAFIGYDLYDISQNGLNWTNGLALTADVVSLALPVVAGGGAAVRAVAHADDIADSASGLVRAVDGGEDSVTVGRWMGSSEYDKMVQSGMVQESRSGTTHVALPASPDTFGRQAKPGTLYAEFEVPSASVKPSGDGIAKIVGPNSLEGRNAARHNRPVPQMPPARNIRHIHTKGVNYE